MLICVHAIMLLSFNLELMKKLDQFMHKVLSQFIEADFLGKF